MAEKQLEFTIKTPECGLGSLVCDESRVMQVLVGLLNNARKFTPEKGSVGCSVSYEERGGEKKNWIKFVVTDTGCGFSGDGADLFRPLVQQKRVEGGVGLGLAIAKDLTELMNGSMFCKSNVSER